MNHHSARQAFIDTILAEPQAESHRLIFADWLEENGDPSEAEKFRTLPGLAGVWSSDWGTDPYGLWCNFTIPTLSAGSSRSASQTMRWIPPGSFRMGSPEDDEWRSEDEKPCHEVELTQGFWMADTPCTQEMWVNVMGDHSVGPVEKTHPVDYVSWESCCYFMDKVEQRIPGLSLSFPTDAQWEYACRAGTSTIRYEEDLDAIAWYQGNSPPPEPQTHRRGVSVGTKKPNAWGLHDTLGSVWEWCLDAPRGYTEESVVDPIGPTEGVDERALRGGSVYTPSIHVRAAERSQYPLGRGILSVGFRCISEG